MVADFSKATVDTKFRKVNHYDRPLSSQIDNINLFKCHYLEQFSGKNTFCRAKWSFH